MLRGSVVRQHHPDCKLTLRRRFAHARKAFLLEIEIDCEPDRNTASSIPGRSQPGSILG